MFQSELRDQLLAMRQRDHEKREELIRRGELFLGYHPEMEAVHVENAGAFESILDEHDWPGTPLVGDDGAEAALIIALHAIGLPAFQRRCLDLLVDAAEKRHAKAHHHAMLVDRVRYNERRAQLYGTIFDWDEAGEMSPWPIEDAKDVEARRREVGLQPLEGVIAETRARAVREGGEPPKPFADRQSEIREWARRSGWLE